jgi:hypothetical protein
MQDQGDHGNNQHQMNQPTWQVKSQPPHRPPSKGKCTTVPGRNNLGEQVI